MKIESRRLFAILMLTALLLMACKIASIEITKHTDEPVQTTTNPVEAATNASVSEPTKAISQTAPTEEGSIFYPKIQKVWGTVHANPRRLGQEKVEGYCAIFCTAYVQKIQTKLVQI